MDERQREAVKQGGGTLLIYAVFCGIMLGVYVWSVRRSQQLARLAAERAEPPAPRQRRSAPKTNGNGDGR